MVNKDCDIILFSYCLAEQLNLSMLSRAKLKDVVKINVDGIVYTFSCTKIALAIMFSNRNNCLATPNANGVYTFANRNSEAFALIHQYYESDGYLNTAMLDILTNKIHIGV